MSKLKEILLERKKNLAECITNENGKPIKETNGEIEKSIKLIEYYQNNAKDYLADENIQSKFLESYVIN